MKSAFKKELLFGLRNHKFLIIIATFLFFAFSIPVMIKFLLPSVLRSQFPGMSETDIAMMIDISQMGSMTNYMENVFEIGLIVIGFTLAGLIAQEIKENTLVLSVCSGERYQTIIQSKFIVFGLLLFSTSMLSIFLTYVYSGLVFSMDLGWIEILKAGLLDSMYLLFVLALILFFGVLTKKVIATGLLSIGTTYVISLIGSLFDINHILPSGLHIEAGRFQNVWNIDTWLPFMVTVGLIGILYMASLYRLKTMEWNQR